MATEQMLDERDYTIYYWSQCGFIKLSSWDVKADGAIAASEKFKAMISKYPSLRGKSFSYRVYRAQLLFSCFTA